MSRVVERLQLIGSNQDLIEATRVLTDRSRDMLKQCDGHLSGKEILKVSAEMLGIRRLQARFVNKFIEGQKRR
jgi:hypothetical protein